MKYLKPQKNILTFYTCDSCGKKLNQSEASLSNKCYECLNPKKKKEPEKVIIFDHDKFELERKIISYMGVDYTLIIYADPQFNPIPEILNSDGVCLYYGNSAENPEGESIYAYCISKQFLKPLKDGKEKRHW